MIVLVGLLSIHNMPYILLTLVTVDEISSQAYGVPICPTQLLNNSSVCKRPKHDHNMQTQEQGPSFSPW